MIYKQSLPFQQYQLRVRRAAGARAHLPVRETSQQDRHSEVGNRLHRVTPRGAGRRIRPINLRREVPSW